MSLLVYFSSSSENTHRFIVRLGLPAQLRRRNRRGGTAPGDPLS